jgi:hypothetical protein
MLDLNVYIAEGITEKYPSFKEFSDDAKLMFIDAVKSLFRRALDGEVITESIINDMKITGSFYIKDLIVMYDLMECYKSLTPEERAVRI